MQRLMLRGCILIALWVPFLVPVLLLRPVRPSGLVGAGTLTPLPQVSAIGKTLFSVILSVPILSLRCASERGQPLSPCCQGRNP